MTLKVTDNQYGCLS